MEFGSDFLPFPDGIQSDFIFIDLRIPVIFPEELYISKGT
jgi:hypothetical protein